MSEHEALRFWNPKQTPLPERCKDPCKDGYIYPMWTRVWNIGDYKTGGDVRIVDKRAAFAASGDKPLYSAEVYGEVARIIAIIAPTHAIPFTPGTEAVVCVLELSNPDKKICTRILKTQQDTLQQLPRSDADKQDNAPAPAYRDDSKYVCVLLQNVQLDVDDVAHATPLLSTSTGIECVRGHDGHDYDGESIQYRTYFERNAFCIDEGFDILVDPDHAGEFADMMELEGILKGYTAWE